MSLQVDLSYRLLGTTAALSEVTGFAQTVPIAAGLKSGRHVVAWLARDNEREAFDGDLRLRLVEPDGSAVGPGSILAVTNTAPETSGAFFNDGDRFDILPLNSGGFALLWQDSSPTVQADFRRDSVLRFFDGNGAPVSANIIVKQSEFFGDPHALVNLSQDRIGVFYIDSNAPVDSDFRMNVYGSDGTLEQSNIILSGRPFVTSGRTFTYFSRSEPRTSELSNGGFAVTYYSSVFGSEDVFVEFYTADLKLIRIETANALREGRQWFQQVAGLAGGGAVVAWINDRTGASDELRFRVFDRNLAPIGSDVVVQDGASGLFSITALADGNFALISGGQSISTATVRLFTARGEQFGSSFQVTDPAGVYNPSLAATADGALAISWQSGLGGNQIRSQKLVWDENVTGTAGNDRWVASGGNDRLDGLGGDDTLSGGGGNDMIDGGAGFDTAGFSGRRADYTVTRIENMVTVRDLRTIGDGTDTLTNIERLEFSDGALSFFGFLPPGPVRVANFAVGAGGWSTQDRFPRQMADVNGDGFADIVGFGQAGVLVALGSANGTFAAPVVAVANFGVDQGWMSDNIFHRELADVNGDGRDDIVGFGTAGVLVSLAQANGTFGAPALGSSNFNPANGWTSQNGFARTLADVNGDGFADIVGFGTLGTFVALGTGTGSFGAASFALDNFGTFQGWTSNNQFHREVGDVNGDGRADIVGFGTAGTLVALGQANGTFAAPVFALGNFGSNQGWTSQDMFTRDLADVNGDGQADVVGFGVAGTFVAYGLADGLFAAAEFELANFGRDQGWTSDNIFHRELADVNGDGRADIVGFGQNGVFAALAFDGQVI